MTILNNYNRDVFVGEFAKNLIEEERSLFGFAYIENDTIQYFFTENETACFCISQQKYQNNICITPIEMITHKKTVTASANNQIEYDLREVLQRKYSEDYFRFLNYFIASESDNQAQPLLSEYLDSFPLEAEIVSQQANYNLITLAYCAKHINERSYSDLIKKSHYVRNEITKAQAAPNSKILAGIGYFQPDQTIAYYCNAYLPNVYKKKIGLEKKNHIVSPILHINYDLSNINNHSMKDLKENFMNSLKQTIDLEYLNLVQEIKTLSSAINPLLFQKQFNSIQSQLTDHAMDAVESYSRLWNISIE